MFRDDPANVYEFDITELARRPSWHNDAACRGQPAVNFYPVRGETAAPALAICAGCRVREECLAEGVSHNERGVWGGSTAHQRRQIRSISVRGEGSLEPTRELSDAN